MKASKSGKKRATAKAPKKAPVKKAAKRAVKKIAPKKASIAAIKPISFTPKDLDKLKEAMLDKNLPKEIRAVLDAASKGNFDAFNGAVQSLSPKRLGELVGALDWDSEAGSAALGKLDKGAQAFKEGILHGPLPDAPTLVKCCCDPRIFGELRTLCHGLFCCCCGCCCSWDDLCLHLRCRCGIPVYKGTETTCRRATSFRFTDDFSVTFSPVFPTYPYLPAQATIDFNSGAYYTKTDVDGLLTGKSDTSHNHTGVYATPTELTAGLSTKANSVHAHDDLYYTEGEIDTKLTGKSDTSHNHTGVYATPSDLSTGLATKSDTTHDHPHKQAAIVNGSIPYNTATAYIAGTGFTIDASGAILAGFTLVRVYATGYKTDLAGARAEALPLILEGTVSGTNIVVRVWDSAGNEYGVGATWTAKKAHIDYTLLTQK